MTNVEECTRAETGVGAAIAAGNQAENGICALFVIAANTTNPNNKLVSATFLLLRMPKLNSP